MRLIIAGSRTFNSIGDMTEALQRILGDTLPSVVISGTARGADSIGEMWAEHHNVAVLRMPANWDKHGKSAGYRRNERMAQAATHLVAFYDGESKGTRHMIDIARREGLDVRIVRF